MTANNNNENENGEPSSSSSSAPSFPASTSTSSRGKNWSKLEDRQLCRSWLGASADANVVTGQQGGRFWERITADFNREHTRNRVEGEKERSVRALNSRWTHIQYRVCIYTGVLEQAIREVSADDIFVRAGELYTARLKAELDVDEEFKLQHCYQELRDQPKWAVQMNKLRARLDKGKGKVGHDMEEELELRPKQQQQKNNNKRTLMHKSQSNQNNSMVFGEDILEKQRLYNEAKRQRREDLDTNRKIMSVDLDNCTNDNQRKFFGVWQALIVKELEETLGKDKINELLNINNEVEYEEEEQNEQDQ